ncbi:hypothetical protein LCGC14_1855830 [marine sediment metagenome]|uniref:Uncharacterized protein n=1 Tax=marine sediment metagenome TaxID=412755 RepID=A0A0F9ETD3_9ZZZZ
MNNRKWMQLSSALIIASILLIGAVQRFDHIQAKKITVTGSGGLVLGVSSGALRINGKQLILDVDADTSITCDTDDQCDWELGGQDEYVFTAAIFDIGEGTLTRIDLDADNDTSIRSRDDDTIDFELGGSDVFSMTASNFYLNAKILATDEDQDTTIRSSVDDVLTITLGAVAGHLDVAIGNLKVGDGTPSFTQDGEDAYVEGVLEAASDVIMGAQSTISVVFGIPITPTGWYQPIESADFGAGDGQAVTPIAAPSGDTNGTRLLLYNINASQVITIDGTGTTVECKADVILAPTDTLELFWNGDDWKCISNYDNS